MSLESGGTVTVAVPALPTNFNPESPPGANAITNEVMAGVWPHTFVTDQRFNQVAGEGFVLSAEVYGVSPFTVVYKLNPKAVWSDGVPIAASDFIYDWHQELHFAALLPHAGIVAGYRQIASMSGTNSGHTLTVVFKQPFADWESLFSTVVPAHVAQQYGWVSAFQGFNATRVISGGPFMIASYVPGKRLVLVRNPRYWGTPAQLSRIVLEVESPPSALAGLETGAISMAEVAPGPAVTNTVARAAGRGVALYDSISLTPTLWQLCFNMTDPSLSSLTLRTAIADSLDVAGVTSNSVGLVDWLEAPNTSRLTIDGQPGSGTAVAPLYDLSTALSLYRQAGYRWGSDGEMRSGGTGPVLSLSLDVPSGSSDALAAADNIAAQLEAIGLRVHVALVGASQLLGNLLPLGSYQLAIAPFSVPANVTGLAAVYTPAETDASLPWSLTGTGESPIGAEPGAVTAGVVTRNVFGLSDPVVTTDLEQASTQLNQTVSNSYLQKADLQLWTDLPTIPLFQQPVSLVHRAALVGVTESPTLQGAFWNVQNWAWQASPPVPVPTFPGISQVSPIGPTQVAP